MFHLPCNSEKDLVNLKSYVELELNKDNLLSGKVL